LLRTRGIRKRAQEAGKAFDESEEGAEWQAKGMDLERKLFNVFSKKDEEQVDEGTETLVTPEQVTPKTVPNAVV
jgi:hypothetical protein